MLPYSAYSYPFRVVVTLLWPIALFPLVAGFQMVRGRAPYVSDGVHQPVVAAHAQVSRTFTTPQLWLAPRQRHRIEQEDNHAVVEFKRDGRLADPCDRPHKNNFPCQLDYARDFIQTARSMLKDGEQLNVIVYIHGNENWAGEDSDNYPHFRQTINCLNLGTEKYYQKYLTGPAVGHDVLDCADTEDPLEFKAHFVGIYFGWQGNTTGTPLNMREAVAHKVANAAASDVVKALYQLRDAAKAEGNTNVRFIVLGHSFGGLILENTVLKIYQRAHLDKVIAGPCPEGGTGVLPFADLMVTIAAAEHAIKAKQIIDLLQTANTDGISFCHSKDVAPSLPRPVLVSLVSKHDFWSYGLGSNLRHLLGHEPETVDAVAHPIYVVEDEPSPKTLEWQTPSVVTYFQNICYLHTPFSGGSRDFEREQVCDAERDALPSDENSMDNARAFPGTGSVSPLSHLYVRFNCKLASSTDANDSRPPCTGGYPNTPITTHDLHVWNQTPFWIGAIDIDIFDGHGPFGFPRFNQLLADMGGSLAPLPAADLLPTPAQYISHTPAATSQSASASSLPAAPAPAQ